MRNFRLITAKDNQIIKLAALLQKSPDARKENGLFVLEGLRLCKDAMAAHIKFQTLIMSESAILKLQSDLEDLTANASDLVRIPDELFKKISDTVSPQGVLAIAKMPAISAPVLKDGRYIALEHIADPGNIGTIARTAEALGISGIIISGDSCDIYSPKVLRASMGTVLRVPIYVCDNVLEFLSDNNLRAFACVPSDLADLKFGKFSFSGGDAVIIGNEANGLLESTIAGSYKTITISMRGKAESLNAASAAAIAMFELMK